MNLARHLPARARALGRFLREELTEARPGRVAQAVQLGSLSLVIVLVSMTLSIPLAAVSLIVLFYGVQSNSFFTRVVCVVFIVATFLDTGSLLLVLKFAYGYPLVRIVAASALLFLSMFLFRTNKLGLMFFAVALVAAYGQTIPDSLDFPELAVRALLWAGAAGLYVVLLMALVCGYLFPARPLPQLQRELRRQLSDVDAHLGRLASAAGLAGAPDVAPDVAPDAVTDARIEKDALALKKLDAFAGQDDAGYRAARGYWQACVAVVPYLRAATNALATRRAVLGEAGRALSARLQREVAALGEAVAEARPYRSTWTPTAAEQAAAGACGLGGVARALGELGRFDPGQPARKAPKEGLFVADALTNPVYLRFSFKVVLASLICYVMYHGMQWDGIHTCMLTCVIVAYPSTGASIQKMLLRFGGAVIGALLALLVTIFVVPRIDSIFGLLVTLAPIFFAGAWVTTGSERSSYIGTQFVFTFAMATLESGFGPVYDLVEIRDRIIGIFIGIVVSSLIYLLIWPESEIQALREKLVDALRQIGKLMPQRGASDDAAQLDYLAQRIACAEALSACEDMCERVAFEFNLRSERRNAFLVDARGTLAQSRRIVESWDGLRDALLARSGAWPDDAALQAWCESMAGALERYADALARQTPGAIVTPLAPAISQAVEQQRELARQVAALPDWTASACGIQSVAVQSNESS